MKVILIVDGKVNEYEGDYHELHSDEWNERVRLALDGAYEAEQERNQSHGMDNLF